MSTGYILCVDYGVRTCRNLTISESAWDRKCLNFTREKEKTPFISPWMNSRGHMTAELEEKLRSRSAPARSHGDRTSPAGLYKVCFRSGASPRFPARRTESSESTRTNITNVLIFYVQVDYLRYPDGFLSCPAAMYPDVLFMCYLFTPIDSSLRGNRYKAKKFSSCVFFFFWKKIIK